MDDLGGADFGFYGRTIETDEGEEVEGGEVAL